MSKLVTVIGATGIQGGSVVTALLKDPAYSIRAITRNSKSDAAQALVKKGVQVVEADINNAEALRAAFAGSYAIFAVTNFFEALGAIGEEKSAENEIKTGIKLADAAAATESLQHYVWSTLPNSRRNSDGKAVVPYFDSKNKIDAYIKTLPDLLRKTTFLWLGWYASNYEYPIFRPMPIRTMDGSKSYVQFINVDPSVPLPMLGDVETNPGIFAKSVLDQPEKTLPGKAVAGSVEFMTFGETLAAFAAAKNIQARCVQISKEDYAALWPVWGETLNQSHHYFEVIGEKGMSDVHGDMEVVTKEDLGIKGLVSTAESFAAMRAFE